MSKKYTLELDEQELLGIIHSVMTLRDKFNIWEKTGRLPIGDARKDTLNQLLRRCELLSPTVGFGYYRVGSNKIKTKEGE